MGLDLNPDIVEGMARIGAVGKVVNLTDDAAVQAAIAETVRNYGGIDIVVSNAGIFTAGQYLEDLESSNWDKALAVNLTSHQRLLKFTIPYLKQGIDSSIILVGSRNVKAPVLVPPAIPVPRPPLRSSAAWPPWNWHLSACVATSSILMRSSTPNCGLLKRCSAVRSATT